MENSSGNKSRLAYIDNVRSLVIVLVVAMHSSVCYSGIGGWYYKEGLMEQLGAAERAAFAFLQSYTQAWFLGVLFFVSGYFAELSITKKGSVAFAKERLFRLGFPLLVYMFVVAPFIYFILMKNMDGAGLPLAEGGLVKSYLAYITSFEWLGSTGPLWFNEALIMFCLVYALCRRNNSVLSVSPHEPFSGTRAFPGKERIALVILGTGIAAFLIRLVFPIGTDVLNLQFSFFASYIALFVLGIKAGTYGWLTEIAEGKGRFWFFAALIFGVPLWFIIMIAGGALEGTLLIYGGLYWQSAVYALWESFVAVGFSFGLVWFFARRRDAENALTRFAAANAFGVYMLHPPVLIGISLLFRFWRAAPVVKFLVVTPLALAGSFCITALLRLIPPVRRLLK